MSAQEQLETLLTATAFDSSGTKVGAVRQVYLDDSTGRATFATVSTGIFSADAIIPLFGARLVDGELHVDFSKAQIKAAPRFDHTEDALTAEQEFDLLEHFGIEAEPLEGAVEAPGDATNTTDTPADAPDAGDSDTTATADTEEAAKPEPGTIPARRLASVEEPTAKPEGDVTKRNGKDMARAAAQSDAKPADGADSRDSKDADTTDKADKANTKDLVATADTTDKVVKPASTNIEDAAAGKDVKDAKEVKDAKDTKDTKDAQGISKDK